MSEPPSGLSWVVLAVILAAALGCVVVSSVPHELLLCRAESVAASRCVLAAKRISIAHHANQEDGFWRIYISGNLDEFKSGQLLVMLVSEYVPPSVSGGHDDIVFWLPRANFLLNRTKFFRQVERILGPYENLRELAMNECGGLPSIPDRYLCDYRVTAEERQHFHACKCCPCALVQSHLRALFAHKAQLSNPDTDQQQRECRREYNVRNGPPTYRRIGLLIGATILVWPISLYGIVMLERREKWRGWLIIASAIGGFAAAESLVILNCFSWSWGWWL